MADNDIYNNKEVYERFIRNIDIYLEKPSGYRKYQIKNRANIKYFNKLIIRFEVRDLSYVRRKRVLSCFLIVCHVIEKDLANMDRDDVDRLIIFANKQHKSDKSKQDFVKNLKCIWKTILPDKDERGRIDDTIVPYVVRHLSTKMDKSREKMRKDRITMDEFEKLIGSFGTDSRMQALLALKLESLGRPQEILGRNIEDVELHENYAKIYISEHGKEGIGFLRCVDSFYYFSKWLNGHPMKNNPKAPLFINLGMRGRYDRLKPPAANKLIREKCRMLGINKPITLYSFKRNGVTLCRLRGDSDADIQHRARWTSTKQLKTYDMSTQDDTFKLELIKRGVIKPDKKFADVKPLTKRCGFCHFENGIGEALCSRCRRPLDRTVIEQAEKRKEEESRKLRDEMVAIKSQLANADSRDEIILKLVKGLLKKGRKKDVLEAVWEEGLAGELVEMR